MNPLITKTLTTWMKYGRSIKASFWKIVKTVMEFFTFPTESFSKGISLMTRPKVKESILLQMVKKSEACGKVISSSSNSEARLFPFYLDSV